jgi:hypothetical protein
MSRILLFLILIVDMVYSSQNLPYSILKSIIQFKSSQNSKDLYLREWLNKLTIDLPNELIKNETSGYIENLTIYNISLENLITTRKKYIENKVGVELTLYKSALNIKGKYILREDNPKDFLAKISSLTVKLPFYLVKNESGLVTEVDTSGFTIDIENAHIELELDTSEMMRNLVVGILKAVLELIKTNVIEKNIIQTLNTKLSEIFQNVNDIILNGVYPEELNITMEESERADLRYSPIMGSIAYLLTNLTGINGKLSLNNLVNIFTYDTGIVRLKDLYEKEIHFEFNLTDENNTSSGNFEFTLDDLNISGLNTWKEFSALEPYDPLQLFTHTNLGNLTINVSFSLRVKLDNDSNLVNEEAILFEKAQLRTNLQNNKLNAMIQFPFNNKRSKEYTNQECLNLDCVIDLVDSNGTGITALSLNETFHYLTLEIKGGEDLEEDLSDAVEKLADLFISGFNNEIGLLINGLLNTSVINFANKKLNEFLYPKNCPGIPEPDDSQVDATITSISVISAGAAFLALMFCPYILGRACKKDNQTNQENLIEQENIAEIKDVKNVPVDAKYCFDNIKIQWIKELGRIDPEGASLFLNPRVPIFFRIFIPMAILFSIALFISSNSGTGASVYIVFNLGRRIKAPSLFDFSLINSVHDMWLAGSEVLSTVVAVFSGVWPYLKLVLMLISFMLPTSILSHKRREKILLILDATGKFSILDSYVLIMMMVAFHFHVEVPLSDQSKAKEGSIVDIFCLAAYSFITLIIGTLISLFLSHVITHLHRHLDEHPDQNKGEKAENYKSIMSFAKNKCISDTPFRIFISSMIFITLGLVIIGSVTKCFSFYFHGLAGYALNLLDYPDHRDFSIIKLGLDVRDVYENPDAPEIIFTQFIYFFTILAIPIAFLVILIILWFVPMSRRAQKFLYSIAEILNAWSCIDVFVIALLASVLQIAQFAEFMVGDKCDSIDPIIHNYFSKTLDGHDSCFEVQTYLLEGSWLFFAAAITFFIASFVILKVCRNALNERLPDHVKEYLKMKKNKNNDDRISNISNINDFSSSKEALVDDSFGGKKILEENDNI